MKRILLLFVCFFPFGVYALDMPEINSEAAIVYDIDADTIILDKNSREVRSIASLTKCQCYYYKGNASWYLLECFGCRTKSG